ncbi:MAG: DUF924 family protein [Pseudomonadota bacterium]
MDQPETDADAKLAHGAPRAGEVVASWRDAGPKLWYAKDDAFDARLRARFGARVEEAESGGLDHWAGVPEGALALILLLDQLPRNLYRGTPRMFATDAAAKAQADAAIAAGFDAHFARDLRQFFYLPYMHSEDLADQERSVALYKALGNAENLRYAEIHAEPIRRFGRFPHRNSILGRETTAEEQAYLDDGGFKG